MKSPRINILMLLLMSVLLPIACGGGGSSDLSAGGGIGGSGIISTGAVTSFGSIVVNGTRFDTSNASLIVNGEERGSGDAVVFSNLNIGQIVTVEGPGKTDFNTAIAQRITYNNNVEGPVEYIRVVDGTTREIVVMGQTVVVNSLTQFKGTGIDSLSSNDLVEISGLFDDRGTIWATFVEKTGAFEPEIRVEVSGFVRNLDTINQIFNINDLTVDYALAEMNSLPQGVPTEGLQIEAEGMLDRPGGILIADTIQPETDLETENAEEIEVIGFVTRLDSSQSFTLGDQAVVVEEGAEIVDGELANIEPGVKLEAEGALVNGVLVAYEVEFWAPDQIEIEGFVTEIISDFEFILETQPVVITEDTEFEDV